MEAGARQVGSYLAPTRNAVISALVLAQQLYPKVITTIRELAGGGFDHAALGRARLRQS